MAAAYDKVLKSGMAPVADMPDAAGYEVITPAFGEGPHGKVWLVRNAGGQWQALKTVYQARFGGLTELYEREFDCLQRYKSMSSAHRGLLRVDFISNQKKEGHFYYVMDLGDGVLPGWEQHPETYAPRDLARVRGEAEGKRLPLQECLRIGIGLAEALEFLHGHSLTHGDIKPQNILFVGGQPKLADVGPAARIPALGQDRARPSGVGYLPPEPETPGTPQADIFSLGMVLYTIFTGRDPEQFPVIATTLAEHANAPEFMRLNAIVLRGCQPDVTKRFASAGELTRALREAQAELGHPKWDKPSAELAAGLNQLALAPQSRPPPPNQGPAASESETIPELHFPSEEKAGDCIGRYKLLQQIGEGGCGVVYMAEQTQPVRRRVALKVIKLGMDTKQVVARFEAERQALALMDHPNIARILDGGVTQTGRPFFVMELVRGIPITRYCDEHKLNTSQRLELFMTVCQAIQHAHQRDIIHRDIKPSNVLVTDLDGVPVPKIIDFGIAKATAGQVLTDKTFFTAFEQFIGTPAYMSPEQAQLSALEIDARSDVYSLGVLLYELLTGKTPFDPTRLHRAGLDEIRRIIREEDPVRPSTRLSTLELDEQTSLAKLRQSQPPRLIGLIRGDLDWIVMKALDKERQRRYESALEVATDVRRFLHQEPIEARPPSKWYRFAKMVRRHKVAFVSAATLISGLLVAAIAILFAVKVSRNSNLVAVPPAKRIAVLSFSNASPGQVEAYLSESLTKELIRTFGKVRGLSAFRPSATFSAQPMEQIRASLSEVANVPLLVAGTIQYREGKVDISARLIETATGTELVSAAYEREPKNMLGIPDDVVLRIAEQTLPDLTAEDQARIRKAPTQNAEAYDHYLRGTVHLRGLFAQNVGPEAIKQLEQAVKLDQDFALAWAELSHAYVSLYFYTQPEQRPVLEKKAFQAFSRALDLDQNLAEAHFAKTYYYWTPSQHWQYETAIKEGRRALELNPNLQEVFEQLSLIYLHCGLFRQGLELAQQAHNINPQLGTYNLAANISFWEGKNEEAVKLWGTDSDQLKVNYVMNSYLAVALINLNRTNEALEIIQRAPESDQKTLGALFSSARAILLAKQGNRTEALAQISQALEQRKQSGHFHHALYNIASAYALLNEQEQALAYLEEAAADGLTCWPLFKNDLNLDSLRNNSEFKDFLARQKAIYDNYTRQFGD